MPVCELPMTRREPRAGATILMLVVALSAVPRLARAADATMSECLAANESAIKLQDGHKLRQARTESLACSAVSCPAEVRESCQGRVARLNAAIPTLVLQAKDGSGADVSHVLVTMDGQPFADRLDGTAIPLDPGDHTFAFAVGGQPTVERRFVVYEGETDRRERVQLGGAAPLRLGPQRTLGIALGGAGVLGVGAGAVLGLVASSAWSSVKSACGPGGASNCIPSTSQASVTSEQSTAKTDGTISTVLFVAGGALIAAGTVVFLMGGHRGGEDNPAQVALTPCLGPGQAGLVVRGGF